MVDAVVIRKRHVHQEPGKVNRIGGRTDLIAHDVEFFALFAKAKHRLDKVIAILSKHPRGADDEISLQQGLHSLFAGKLRFAIDAQRPCRRICFIWRFAGAGVDIVGADVDHFCADLLAGARDILAARLVDQAAKFGIVFRLIDSGIGRAMNHGIRAVCKYELLCRHSLRDVKLGQVRRNAFDSACGKVEQYVMTKLTVCARYEYFQTRFLTL